MNSKDLSALKHNLISLYLEIKHLINNENILNNKNKPNNNTNNNNNSNNNNNTFNSSFSSISEEEKLYPLSPSTLLSYIKNNIDTYVSLKLSLLLNSQKEYEKLTKLNVAEDYETLLRKEENSIRQHISIEHQLKLYGEKLIDKLEDLEKENMILSEKLVKHFI